MIFSWGLDVLQFSVCGNFQVVYCVYDLCRGEVDGFLSCALKTPKTGE